MVEINKAYKLGIVFTVIISFLLLVSKEGYALNYSDILRIPVDKQTTKERLKKAQRQEVSSLFSSLNFENYEQTSESLTDYASDETLGRNLSVFVVVKDDQLSHRYKEFEEQWTLTGGPGRRDSRDYHNGLVFEFSLSHDKITLANVSHALKTKESTGITFHNNLIAITNGDSIIVIDREKQSKRVIHNKKLAHLHDITFSNDGQRLLVTSTGYDKIIEIDLSTEEIIWEWTGWKHGYALTKSGKIMTDNRDEFLRIKNDDQDALLVDDLESFGGYGIPAEDRAMHVNTAIYGPNNEIIATLFHTGEVIAISRETGDFKVLFSGMKGPHGFYRDLEVGYMVTDTRHGKFLRFDIENKRVESLSFVGMPHELDYRKPFGEWLQFVTKLTPNIYAAVNTKNNLLYLIDIEKKTYRSIETDEDLAVQYIKVKPQMPDSEPLPDAMDWFFMQNILSSSI